MRLRSIRTIIAVVATAFVCFGSASTPVLAAEPDAVPSIKVGAPVLPTCAEPNFNVMVSFADYQEDSDLVTTLLEEEEGQWMPVMGGAFIDEIAGNNGVVGLAREFAPGEEVNLVLTVHPPESEGVTAWGPQLISLDCTEDPVPAPTETVTPTQGVTEEVAATSTSTATPSQTATALVTGPVVETDVVDGSPSTTTWVLRRIAPLAMVLSLHLYLWTMVGNGGLMGLVSVRRRH